jgi:hypothetical protein
MKFFAGRGSGGAGIQSPLKGKEGLFIAGGLLAGQKHICERAKEGIMPKVSLKRSIKSIFFRQISENNDYL